MTHLSRNLRNDHTVRPVRSRGPCKALRESAQSGAQRRERCQRDGNSLADGVNFVRIRRDADKSLAFPILLFAAQTKEFFLDGLKKLAQ
jgi:hypothetical protein